MISPRAAVAGVLAALLVLLPACTSFDPWAEYEPLRVVHREDGGLVVRVRLRGVDVEADRAVVLLDVVNEGETEAVVAPRSVTIVADGGLELQDTLTDVPPRTVVLLPGGRSEWRVDCASPDVRRVLDVPMTTPEVRWELEVGERAVAGTSAFELCDPPHLRDQPFQ